MEKSLRYQARRALLQQTVPQYREASPSQKKTLLDAFVAATGYHRIYASWLLNHAQQVQQTLRRPRPPQYGPEVQHAHFLVWNASNRICAKRLMPLLPTLIEALERHEHLQITEECRKHLLSCWLQKRFDRRWHILGRKRKSFGETVQVMMKG